MNLPGVLRRFCCCRVASLKEVKRYDVVEGVSKETLAARVNVKVAVGWQPQGGISSVADGAGFVQAIVKYEDN